MKFDHVANINAGQRGENISLNKSDGNFQTIDNDGESEWHPADEQRRRHGKTKEYGQNGVSSGHVGEEPNR